MNLEKCPFCGKKPRYEFQQPALCDAGVAFRFNLKCEKCGSSTYDTFGYITLNFTCVGEVNIIHDDRQKVELAWNKRYKPKEKEEVSDGRPSSD